MRDPKRGTKTGGHHINFRDHCNMITFAHLQEIGTDPRVHGNGFIQVNVFDNERINFFGHPAIPRQSVASPVHSHRFGFWSEVFRGRLVNARYYFNEIGPDGHTHRAYRLGRVEGEENTSLIATKRTGALMCFDVQLIQPTAFGSGTYRISAGAYHETFANEPTITHQRKMPNTDLDPLVFVPYGREPSNEWTRKELSEKQIWEIIEDCYR